VRTAAVRLSLDRLREHRREVALPEDEQALPPAASGAGCDHSPEHILIRQHYREHFQQAFAAALRTLSTRERTLLRLHLLDGLTEEQLGTMYSAHRVTIARWLRRTREQILRETQRLLAERLGLPPGELESVTGLVPSRLEHSLGSLLRSG
jgi:RNA polymerase sigma-70 factor (ECF subfamily)